MPLTEGIRIREAGIKFDVPGPERLGERLADVLDAIYAAFGAGWDAGTDQPEAVQGLPEEAIYLARLLADLMPDAPDPAGLLSLMLFVHARRRARRGADGAFVPLSRQDAALWDRSMVIEAEGLLTRAAQSGRFGRFPCKSAIQSVHAQWAITGRLNLEALEMLYGLLVAHHPTVGAEVALASVLRQRGRAGEALARLEALGVTGYQPGRVLRAHCLRDLGREGEAAEAARAALALTADVAVRAHLTQEFGLPG